MWWTTGFAWDTDKIADDLTSWDVLWDAAYTGKLAMLDDYRECFAAAAFRLGLRPEHDRRRPARPDARAARGAEAARSGRYTTDDIGVMSRRRRRDHPRLVRRRVPDDDDKPNGHVLHPERGRVRGSDTMVLLSGAPHPIAAHLWINFMLDAEVSAENTNYIGYMGPNEAAQAVHRPGHPRGPDGEPRHGRLLDELDELLDLGADEGST